jgi:ABC-type sugar transport system ATPase subunit
MPVYPGAFGKFGLGGIYLVTQQPSLMATLSVTESLFMGILRRSRFPLSRLVAHARRGVGTLEPGGARS